MVPPSPLEDPAVSRHAWSRYRRILKAMGLVALAVVLAVDGWLYSAFGPVSIHLYIAATLGIGLTMMLAAALMGLAFLSNGTGHDDSVVDPFADDDQLSASQPSGGVRR